MSKLAHSNQATMDEIKREARPAERRIVTSHVFPPIPDRRFDWCASYEDDDGHPSGYGRTEDEAVADLLENYLK